MYNNVFIVLEDNFLMPSEKLNFGFDIGKKDLDERLKFSTQIPQGFNVIPLKRLHEVTGIVPMKREEMEAFIRHIPLVSAKDVLPYKDARISRHMSGPHGLYVPQTFILRSKLISILEGLDNLYNDFCFPSLTKRTSHYVLGRDDRERNVAGVYFPPLVEIIDGGNIALLFDGNHRMALCGIGSSSETILIKNSSVEPPYKGIPWHKNFVDEKPPLEKRYIQFNKDLLKDFDYVGIDG